MARTYAAVEIAKDVKVKGWNLVRYADFGTQLIRKLRKGGFYGNFGSLEELKLHCILQSKGFDVNDPKAIAFEHKVGSVVEGHGQPLSGSKESSSDVKNHPTEQRLDYVSSGNKLTDYNITMKTSCQYKVASSHFPTLVVPAPVENSHPPKLIVAASEHAGIKKGSIDANLSSNWMLQSFAVENWCMSGKGGSYVPITEVPYTGLETPRAAHLIEFWISGYVRAEPVRIKVQEWRLDPTVRDRPAISVKIAEKVWIQLGKPQANYEQTIRNVLVYIQLFSMVKGGSQFSKSSLLQHLQKEFCHWRDKPDETDLHESVLLMKELNLGAALPSFNAITKNFDTIQMGRESDADSDSKPLSFRRIKRCTSDELQLRENFDRANIEMERVSSMQTSNISRQLEPDLDSDQEPLILKRATKLRKRRPELDESHYEDTEVVSHSIFDTDHVLLSSRLTALKRGKLMCQTGKNRLGDAPIAGKDEIFGTDEVECTTSHKSEPNDRNESSFICQQQGSDVIEVEAGSVQDHDQGIHMDSSAQIGIRQNVLDYQHIDSRIKMIIQESSLHMHANHKSDEKSLYSTEPFAAITRLGAVVSAARQALHCLDSGGSLQDAEGICSKQSLMDFLGNEVALMEDGVLQLVPTVSKQKKVAERVNYYAHDGDTVVELCSQAIGFFSLLRERFVNSGKRCDYKRYLVKGSETCGMKDWLSLEKKDLPTGSKLVMCFSFSFSIWGEQINKALDHALELKPKLIVLIAPLFTRRLEEETSYDLVWEDSELTQNEVFWPWGLLDVSDTILDKQKGISPVMFLWSRVDWTTKYRQVASQFGHVQKQGNSIK